MDDPEFDDDSGSESLGSPERFFLAAVGFEIALGIVAVIVGKYFGPVANGFVPPLTDAWSILWGTGLGALLALPMVALVQGLQKLKFSQVEEINRMGRDRMLPLVKELTTSELAILSICAGVGEEMLFRGWLQTLLTGTESQWNPISILVGISVASLAFGLAHAITKLYVAVVFAMGILFGIMLVATGNLLVPIAAHAMFDFIQLRLAVGESKKEADEAESPVGK
ncbi:CAAX amino terminal protease self- immunity [Rosistilla ulvae]|uniref:CAAX amino terminal protease self-immunity n=1 Tax=Rosistilla ulvae TaxID=1930277 RepID=A0A517LVD9_9BACT|nr:type II CAAX endopeptidase family protein [Rosistilla ulvae]QDS86593.1 CAAX amino terminal protease self- immunity [Rosistilla ulvae]